MSIHVYEDEKTGEVVIALGRNFDFNAKMEFYWAYSSFEPCRNFLIDFNDVEFVDYSSLITLLMFKEYISGFKLKVAISGCEHDGINTFLNLPMFDGYFELR